MNWDFFTLHCVCGEQVLYIPPELKDESFRVYELEGIEAIKKLIADHEVRQKAKSDKLSTTTLKILEDQKNNEKINMISEDIQQNKASITDSVGGLIFIICSIIFLSIILLFIGAYFATPFIVEYVEIFAQCKIHYSHWGFGDYMRFWFQVVKYFIGYILAIVFAIIVIYAYAKSEQEKGDTSSGWLKTGAVIGALSSKNTVDGAVKGAAVGYAGHSIFGAIGLIVILLIAFIPATLLGESMQKNMCALNTVGESALTKPDNLTNRSIDTDSNGKQRFLSIIPPSNQENLNCKLLAQYVLDDLRKQVEPNVSSVSIQSISITNVYFEDQDELSCRGWVNLSNNKKALMDFYGRKKGGVYKITYQAASGD